MPTARFDIKDIDGWIAKETGYHPTYFELELGKGKVATWIRHKTKDYSHVTELPIEFAGVKKLKGVM